MAGNKGKGGNKNKKEPLPSGRGKKNSGSGAPKSGGESKKECGGPSTAVPFQCSWCGEQFSPDQFGDRLHRLHADEHIRKQKRNSSASSSSK